MTQIEHAGVRIGLVGGADARQVAALEAMPIDSLWTGGHIASRNPSAEAMMNLARLAALPERVTVGTSILSCRCTRPRSSPGNSPTLTASPVDKWCSASASGASTRRSSVPCRCRWRSAVVAPTRRSP